MGAGSGPFPHPHEGLDQREARIAEGRCALQEGGCPGNQVHPQLERRLTPKTLRKEVTLNRGLFR